MAVPTRELSYGAVEIFTQESDTLGIGSYGKVYKAKCGQLPCAAKLLHDTMFGTNNPGVHKLVERFEQECQFLKAIKHPNIVQFLGTSRDPHSQRLVLLMELMDESLTRYLERSAGLPLYHTQLNICQDVALALAYLHSNDIIHRDLSSNNVLLIGEGSRAKVTDFGMSMLEGINPRMTPLTMCPGTVAYMPPEALVALPQYFSKLDCFSHGVLTIQIATKQFPNPGQAKIIVDDVRSPTGKLEIPVAEAERRKKDIDLIEPNHPLLPLALQCLKDRDTERPSADELCERLTTLKCEPRYTYSVEQSREQNMSLRTLQQQIQEKEVELEKTRANHETELCEFHATFQKQVQEKEKELETVRANHQKELHECHSSFQQQIEELNKKLDKATADKERIVQEKTTEIEQLRRQLYPKKDIPRKPKVESDKKQPKTIAISGHKVLSNDPVKLRWRQGKSAPETMLSNCGAAVVHGNTAYFSQNYSIHSYSSLQDKWSTLAPRQYETFSLAVVNNMLTTIGGAQDGTAINTLFSLDKVMKWKQLLPPMPTAQVRPAAVTTPTHLVVAGGRTVKALYADAVLNTEVLDFTTLQWSSATSSPKRFWFPHMTLCSGYLYLSQDAQIFSCSVRDLLRSCKPPSTKSASGEGGSVWTKLADIPIPCEASLTTLKGHVLAMGGRNYGGDTIRSIHSYNRSSRSWSIVGEIPTRRGFALVAVLPADKLLVVGGKQTVHLFSTTEIGSTD